MRRDMRFPTMWYVRPAKAQISLRIRHGLWFQQELKNQLLEITPSKMH